MHFVREIVGETLVLTSFVFVMMLVIEYVNVLTRGHAERLLAASRFAQPLVGAALGVVPGCLGAFAAASLYMHRAMTFGGLVATMITASGDEAFVMLGLFPGRALLLFGVQFLVGAAVGFAVDAVARGRRTRTDRHGAGYRPLHDHGEVCRIPSWAGVREQWRRLSLPRGVLAFFLALFVGATVAGELGHEQQAWVRVTAGVLGLAALWIVGTVPEHFLEEHLWRHLVGVHVWRIFLWTLGALVLVHAGLEHLDLARLVEERRLPVLALACLVGIIPESGPHLVFATLYAQGSLPFSILLANSIVQDGHGMIPILAHSRRAFVAVKLVSLGVGLALGLAGYALGW
jgi:hypothetical protein